MAPFFQHKIGVRRHFLHALSIVTRDEPTDEHGNQRQRVLSLNCRRRATAPAVPYDAEKAAQNDP